MTREGAREACDRDARHQGKKHCQRHESRPQIRYDTAVLDRKRVFSRHYVLMRLPICGAQDLTIEGPGRNITEKSLQGTGLSVIVGTCKTLVLQAGDAADIYPFAFEAPRRWARRETGQTEPSAGFEIRDTSEGALRGLRKLIRVLTLGG